MVKMLEKKIDKRVSAVEALNHEWFIKAKKSRAKIIYGLSDLMNLERYQVNSF